MRRRLVRHPDFPCDAVSAVEAEVERSSSGVLWLRYRVTGVTDALVVPPPAPPARTDELWKTTCFEAFVMRVRGDGYYELNLSPSSAWAAYRFDGYRAGMRPAMEIGTPEVRLARRADALELSAKVDLAGTSTPERRDWRLSITAVIAEAGGRTSYWALAHPAGRPDFHHADGFALGLPVTERP